MKEKTLRKSHHKEESNCNRSLHGDFILRDADCKSIKNTTPELKIIQSRWIQQQIQKKQGVRILKY